MNTKTKQGGLGIVSILTIVFIVLKLSGVIKWHWIWVLSPIWISALTVCSPSVSICFRINFYISMQK